MQDQGKRLLIAVALALGVMFAWQVIFPAPKDTKPKDVPAAQVGSGSGSGVAAVGMANPVGVTPDGIKATAPTTRGPEQLIKLSYPNVDAAFSSYGGVLKSWHLTDHRYDRDKSKGELLPQQPDAGVFAVNFANSTYVLPEKAEWVGTKLSDRTVKYTLKTDNLTVEKTFDLVPEAYIVKLTIKVTAHVPAGKEATETLALTTYGFQDPKDGGGGGQSVAPRVWHSSTLRGGEVYNTGVKSLIKKPRYEYGFNWTGFEHPFLLVGIAPKPAPDLTLEKQSLAQGTDGLMRTDILLRPASVFKAESGPVTREVVAYLGPKHYSQLEAADSVAGFTTGFKETINLGWFHIIGKPLMWLLIKFYQFVGNWGLAIMLLTLLVKGLTIPFTTKSMRSMKAMAVLAPQMKALQEKYKDDRQRLQMETMALYKQHGANPLSGCLPILLQMPIWLALYRMLSATGELYQQPFIPGWINDLTAADPTHVLPVILLITMFLQARLQPASPDPSQKMQQNMMKYGLPLMFGVMSWFFPAGLALYIFTNTCLSALHSIYMNKFDRKSVELAAKIKAAQEKAAQDKDKGAAAKAKNANVKDTTDKDTTDEDDDDDAESAAEPAKITARPNPNRIKRKKRRR
ncbi:MAG TPA: membrane protein insertase YidC [Kofleriaceae bacterium]